MHFSLSFSLSPRVCIHVCVCCIRGERLSACRCASSSSSKSPLEMRERERGRHFLKTFAVLLFATRHVSMCVCVNRYGFSLYGTPRMHTHAMAFPYRGRVSFFGDDYVYSGRTGGWQEREEERFTESGKFDGEKKSGDEEIRL